MIDWILNNKYMWGFKEGKIMDDHKNKIEEESMSDPPGLLSPKTKEWKRLARKASVAGERPV